MSCIKKVEDYDLRAEIDIPIASFNVALFNEGREDL
jgi:hypothetical protein